MRGSGPRGAGRRRPPSGGGDDPPCTPASLAGCYSARRRAPLWTCLLLCAALRTLLASPSNEGRAMGRSPRRPGADGRVGAWKCGSGRAGHCYRGLDLTPHLELTFVFGFRLPFALSAFCGCIVCYELRSAGRRTCLCTEAV